MSTEKAWQDAIAQWATPFVRSTEVPSSIPPPQYAIFGLNTSHEPLANPVRSQQTLKLSKFLSLLLKLKLMHAALSLMLKLKLLRC